jgi:hypothetical protein
MSLVWLGWTLGALRELRSETIGAERALDIPSTRAESLATEAVPELKALSERQQRMVMRFANDMDKLCQALGRVVKPGGHAVLVVADSQLTGVSIENSAICNVASRGHGFKLKQRQRRPIPAHHRYLPPPNDAAGALSQRMREEVIFTFERKHGPTRRER